MQLANELDKPMASLSVQETGTDALLNAFELIPVAQRDRLQSYFESPLGKYALPNFLSALSEWWLACGQDKMSSIPAHSLSGSWRDDPDWDEMMQQIEVERKRDMEIYK